VSGIVRFLLSAVHAAVGEVFERAVAAGVDLGQVGRPREADHLPADSVTVAAVDRVRKEALPGVGDEQVEEVEVRLGVRLS
jgi:hypothetical protein